MRKVVPSTNDMFLLIAVIAAVRTVWYSKLVGLLELCIPSSTVTTADVSDS